MPLLSRLLDEAYDVARELVQVIPRQPLCQSMRPQFISLSSEKELLELIFERASPFRLMGGFRHVAMITIKYIMSSFCPR